MQMYYENSFETHLREIELIELLSTYIKLIIIRANYIK